MKILSDYFSIICFFIAWMITRSIYTATTIGMISSGVQFICMLAVLRDWKKVRMIAITTGFWLIFGGLTLIFHDQRFIQWKPTILYWTLALTFSLSPIIFKKNLYKKLLQDKICMNEIAWRVLNNSWVIFFIIMGIANLAVVYTFNLKIWIYYKIFGTMALSLIFIIAQAIYMNRHIIDENGKNGKNEKNEISQ